MIIGDCFGFAVWFSRVRHGHNALPSTQLVLLCYIIQCYNTMLIYKKALSDLHNHLHAGAVYIQITRSLVTLNAMYRKAHSSLKHLWSISKNAFLFKLDNVQWLPLTSAKGSPWWVPKTPPVGPKDPPSPADNSQRTPLTTPKDRILNLTLVYSHPAIFVLALLQMDKQRSCWLVC